MRRRTLWGLAALSLCAGCAVGPDYKRADVATPASYKHVEGWGPAAPADAAQKGDWWAAFDDPVLDELEQKVAISNQNVAAYAAAYEQARALVREQRASMFPSVDLTAGATRTQNSTTGIATGFAAGGATSTVSSIGPSNIYQINIGATWEPDLWGGIRRGIENARANAAASAGDVANARLSAQGELASDYWQLRETDAESELVAKTVDAYQRSLDITQNRYSSSIAAKTDVLQAQAQLYSTQATLAGLVQQRSQLENAIAVLTGQAPANFSLEKTAWNMQVPQMPPQIPAQLLQRRPDIAAAERRMAAANAEIGVNKAAYFPTLSLTPSGGTTGTQISELFTTPSYFWSLGLSATETLFDAGAHRAAVAAARATYDQSVANYRQTTLSAMQNVENDLVALKVLERQYQWRQKASAAADETEERTLNQYRAGLISYTDVVTVQATALADRTSLVQAARDRQTTTVALIQDLGGGWNASSALNQ